jgi:hypothetical protein
MGGRPCSIYLTEPSHMHSTVQQEGSQKLKRGSGCEMIHQEAIDICTAFLTASTDQKLTRTPSCGCETISSVQIASLDL